MRPRSWLGAYYSIFDFNLDCLPLNYLVNYSLQSISCCSLNSHSILVLSYNLTTKTGADIFLLGSNMMKGSVFWEEPFIDLSSSFSSTRNLANLTAWLRSIANLSVKTKASLASSMLLYVLSSLGNKIVSTWSVLTLINNYKVAKRRKPWMTAGSSGETNTVLPELFIYDYYYCWIKSPILEIPSILLMSSVKIDALSPSYWSMTFGLIKSTSLLFWVFYFLSPLAKPKELGLLFDFFDLPSIPKELGLMFDLDFPISFIFLTLVLF